MYNVTSYASNKRWGRAMVTAPEPRRAAGLVVTRGDGSLTKDVVHLPGEMLHLRGASVGGEVSTLGFFQ
jgi:hypothetical protein